MSTANISLVSWLLETKNLQVDQSIADTKKSWNGCQDHLTSNLIAIDQLEFMEKQDAEARHTEAAAGDGQPFWAFFVAV